METEYQIIITKRQKNPDYKEEDDPFYTKQFTSPPRYIDSESLRVDVTTEQFEAIRKAVLEKF